MELHDEKGIEKLIEVFVKYENSKVMQYPVKCKIVRTSANLTSSLKSRLQINIPEGISVSDICNCMHEFINFTKKDFDNILLKLRSIP
ncbi:MAG: hypothetical protein LBM77_07660 [Spirochaetaceae bacterium]|nr:hypothetical protein [Spirochaetaceae bacterium]